MNLRPVFAIVVVGVGTLAACGAGGHYLATGAAAAVSRAPPGWSVHRRGPARRMLTAPDVRRAGADEMHRHDYASQTVSVNPSSGWYVQRAEY